MPILALDCVLKGQILKIPLKSGQVRNIGVLVTATIVGLNPFEIRAGSKHQRDHRYPRVHRLNPFEIRAGSKRPPPPDDR